MEDLVLFGIEKEMRWQCVERRGLKLQEKACVFRIWYR